MRMKVYKSSGEAGSGQVQIADFMFVAGPVDPGKLFVPDAGVRVAPGLELHFSSAYGLSNQNLMLTVRRGDSHILTATCHWGGVSPYFAFRVQGDNLIELYFEK